MKLAKVRLVDQVVAKIQGMILQGIYKPREKLPVENELAEMFSVSRVTIREAFVQLSIMDIVDIRQGDGTYVKSVSPESFMKPLLPMLILNKKNLTDIYVTRIAIEGKTAELAALNATDKDIADLRGILQSMYYNFEQNNFEQYHENDYIFHLSVARFGKNTILPKILEILQDCLKYSITAASNEPVLIEKSIKLHRLIVDAIAERNPEKAVEHMLDHIKGGMVYFKDS